MNQARQVVLAAVAVAGLFGCVQPLEGAPRSSGSLALSLDDALLYAVDTDNGLLAVIDPATREVLERVPVGEQPVRVVVGADDSVYVVNRGDRSVAVLRRGDWNVAARLEVGVEPTGAALTPDGKTLLVTSSTARDAVEFGVLTAFDTATLALRWELPVGPEPRGVAVVGERAFVSLYKDGEVAEVSLTDARLSKGGLGVHDKANASRISSATAATTVSTFRARAVHDLVATPDGLRLFAPVVWAREDAIARRPSASGGYYSSGGPCSVGAVATAGLLTVDVGGEAKLKVDDLTACAAGTNTSASLDFPVSSLASRTSRGDEVKVVQGPTVGVVDATGTWLYLVNRESRNVAVLPTSRRTGGDLSFERTGNSIRSVVDVGAGADGIALSGDGLRAYVYSQFDHRVDVLEAQGGGERAQLVNTNAPIQVAGDVLSAERAEGRRLFFDARDRRISNALTNVACSTCHLEGREDGHVWQFPDGPRQTPALAGRKLLSTAPYHWSGEFKDMAAFTAHTVVERMGGTGLTPELGQKLDQYLDSLEAAPSPLAAKDPEALARGRAAFEKGQCVSCHAGALLTNNQNADVGTLSRAGRNVDNGPVVTGGFNVPSLLGLGRSAPYLHTGTQVTVDERVYAQDERHGAAQALSSQEKADLVVYLKSL